MSAETNIDDAEFTVDISPSLLLSLPPVLQNQDHSPGLQSLSSYFCFVFGDGVNSDGIFLLD